MDAVFLALSHQVRRKILDIIKDRPGCSVGDVALSFDISRIAVMKHLRVLEDAGLLVSRRAGRRRELFFNAVPIQMIHDRWSDEYSRFWASQALDLKYAIENQPPPENET